MNQKGCFAGARELRSGRDKGTKTTQRSRNHDLHSQLATRAAYMTAISGSSSRIQSSSPCPTTSVPRSKRRIVEQIELLQDYIDKLAYSEANWNGERSGFWTDRDSASTSRTMLCAVKRSFPGSLPSVTGKIQGIGHDASTLSRPSLHPVTRPNREAVPNKQSHSRRPANNLVAQSTTRNPYLYLGRATQYRFASFKRSTWSGERSN